jgi:peptidylprolyl isomerase
MGGSKLPDLKAEFSKANFGRGAIGAARGEDPNSANSQFFICYRDCSFLNGQYTIWGQVVQGMENVDKLAKGDPNVNDGQVANPDKIVKMQIAADAKP